MSTHLETYYSATAAADIMGQPRVNVLYWSGNGTLPPDALIAPGKAGEKPQPVWTRQHLENRGTQGAETPPTFYSLAAARSYTGLTRSTFDNYRKRLPLAADARLIRSMSSHPVDLWTEQTLAAWTNEAMHSLRVQKPQPMELYTPDEAGRLLGVPTGALLEHMAAHPLTPTAVAVSPAVQLWDGRRLRGWAADTDLPARGQGRA